MLCLCARKDEFYMENLLDMTQLKQMVVVRSYCKVKKYGRRLKCSCGFVASDDQIKEQKKGERHELQSGKSGRVSDETREVESEGAT